LAKQSTQRLKRKRQRAYWRGRAAEFVATIYLRLKGYHILARGYRKPFGEIDIIARRGFLLIAVEVKSRQSMTDAAQSISRKQQRRIRRAMEAFVMEKPKYGGHDIRFDVILVTKFLRLPRHIENAWD